MGIQPEATPGRTVDVCTGDADGLCTTLQWRLHQPASSQLMAGVQGDRDLLDRVQVGARDHLLICNLPFDAHRDTLRQLLRQGATVRYLDGHPTEARPVHPRLQATLGSTPHSCSSLLVNDLLDGAHLHWALVGAYGSGCQDAAQRLGQTAGLATAASAHLKTLGELISYNARATHPQDAYVEPAALYALMARYADPLDLLQHETLVPELEALRRADLQQALALPPYWQDAKASVYVLPDAPWGHRACAYLNGQYAHREPQRANAVLRPNGAGYFQAKVQASAPAAPASGGIAARARRWVIERLPITEVDLFIRAFSASGWGDLRTPVFRAWH